MRCKKIASAEQRTRSAHPARNKNLAHRIDFPDYTNDELFKISKGMLANQSYIFMPAPKAAMREYIDVRRN